VISTIEPTKNLSLSSPGISTQFNPSAALAWCLHRADFCRRAADSVQSSNTRIYSDTHPHQAMIFTPPQPVHEEIWQRIKLAAEESKETDDGSKPVISEDQNSSVDAHSATANDKPMKGKRRIEYINWFLPGIDQLNSLREQELNLPKNIHVSKEEEEEWIAEERKRLKEQAPTTYVGSESSPLTSENSVDSTS
jgi:hypothetical protein